MSAQLQAIDMELVSPSTVKMLVQALRSSFKEKKSAPELLGMQNFSELSERQAVGIISYLSKQ
jgi:hypothetical protein